MPIEVFSVVGMDSQPREGARGQESFRDKTAQEIGEELKSIYDNVVRGSGTIIAAHTVKVGYEKLFPELTDYNSHIRDRGSEAIFIVADMPSVPDSTS